MRYEKQLLGLIGANGSGKSTVCAYLKTKGFSLISLSDYIREEARALGISEDRDALTQLSNQLKTENGESVFAQKAFAVAQEVSSLKIAFDSIRHPKECAYLQEKGVTLIGLSASLEARFERIQARALARDEVSFEQFKAQDSYERTGKSSGQHIDACLDLCHYQIQNDGNLEDLHRQIERLIMKEMV